MREERLEIVEKQVHREGDERAIELCQEIRRLQARISRLTYQSQKRRPNDRHPYDPVERFWLATRPGPNDCLLWCGTLKSDGYGRFAVSGNRYVYAHIYAFTLAHGRVSAGHELHHTCEVRHCVNPDHLRPLTPEKHRELTNGRRYGEATHCQRGHAWDEENTQWVEATRHWGRHRRCRACDRLIRETRSKEWNRRAREKRRLAGVKLFVQTRSEP